MTDTADTYERDLTPREIDERTKLRDSLDDERDALLTSIEDRRREIRGFNASRKKLESRIRDLRRELRSGKVIESRQTDLAFPSEPAMPSDWDQLSKRFPVARDAEHLHTDLAIVLQGVLVPSIEKLEQWHPDTGIFQGIAHWAQLELAYVNRTELAKFNPEFQLPPRRPMPQKLAELRAELKRIEEARSNKRAPRKPSVAEREPVERPARAGKKARRASKKREVRA